METKQKILVADDDPDILEAIQLILQVSHYNVETVKDGKKIVAKMKDFKPDLVLLDLWMSGVSGIDICREIKKNKEFQSVPVVLISASSEIKKNSKIAGVNDFIAKPFEMEELLMKVEGNLQNSVN